MKVRLSGNDIEVLMFLGKYKVMLSSDCRRIYKTKDYHRKRLKVLEKERYIKRVDSYYIKLDYKGTKMVKEFGYDYSFDCRKKEYMNRLNEIARIAALSINSSIEFSASWELKDNNIFTETSRKYIGELKYLDKSRIAYYISRDKDIAYISQTLYDIRKIAEHKNIIIFLENWKVLNDKQRFVFGKESTVIIKPIRKNLELMRKIEEIDLYQIVKWIYPSTEMLLSNWKEADYMTEDDKYIILMPFLDTEKLDGINSFFKKNPKTDRKVEIITLNENIEIIDKILTNKIKIIEIDNWLGGIDEIEEKG